MLKIKLARFGKRGQPHFRIIVNEARSKRDGQYIALLGQYAPAETPKILKLDLQAYNEWLKKGAQPTPTVAALAKRVESGNPFPEKPKKLSRKAVAKAAAAKEAKEVEPVAPEVEAPVAEVTEPVVESTPEVVEPVVETAVETEAEEKAPAEETTPETPAQ